MFCLNYIVNSVFDSRTYIISQEKSKSVWLIDCGDFEKVLDEIGNKQIIGVFLTHVHFDHIYGIPDLLERFPNAYIYTNSFGKIALADEKLNMSRYHDASLSIESRNIMECKNNDTLSLFDDIAITVYETPGHNPSCLTFMLNNYLFTGDAYIPGVKVVTSLPKSDKVLAQHSLDYILSISDGKTICPGHEVNRLNTEETDVFYK